MSLWPIIWIHWLALALILLAMVAGTGIFDLFWLALAAITVAALSALFPGGGTSLQAGIFLVSSVGLIILGRRFGSSFGLKRASHPNLNQRSRQMIGKRGTALADFKNGLGELKIGDSQWQARCDTKIKAGTEMEVIDSDGTTLIVRPWPE